MEGFDPLVLSVEWPEGSDFLNLCRFLVFDLRLTSQSVLALKVFIFIEFSFT